MAKKNLIVQKYGGSSLAGPEHIRAAADRIAALHRRGENVLVVVSAMGKTTDQLVELAHRVSSAPNRRELDMLLTTGERVSMALMSMALNDRGIEAISFTGSQAGVLTDDSHSNARIIDVRPVRVNTEIARNKVVVLAGFQGVSPVTKEVTTLGRGGSDTTAVALAAHFKAERCEIRKDVDGVYSADPNQVPNARHLPHLHCKQLLDMTFWGAKVLHYRSVELASLLGMPVTVALAHGAESRQTRIDNEGPMYEQARVLSVNSHEDVRWIRVEQPDMNSAMGALYKALRDHKLPCPQILDTSRTGPDQWTFLVTGPRETLSAIGARLTRETGMTMDSRALCTVTATCQGAYASSLPEEITFALAERRIQTHQMLFSAMSLTVVLEAADREPAAQAIHALTPADAAG